MRKVWFKKWIIDVLTFDVFYLAGQWFGRGRQDYQAQENYEGAEDSDGICRDFKAEVAGVEEVMEEGHDEDGADAVAGSHDAVDQSVTFLNRSVRQDGRRVVDKARTDSKH